MYAHEYKLELQVTAIIDAYHRDAILAEQRRFARAGRPSHIATVAMSIRTSVRSLFTKAGAHVHKTPAAHPELVSTTPDTALVV